MSVSARSHASASAMRDLIECDLDRFRRRVLDRFYTPAVEANLSVRYCWHVQVRTMYRSNAPDLIHGSS
jgi:hypothetical protein